MPLNLTNLLAITLAVIVSHGEAQAVTVEPCGSSSNKSGQTLGVIGSGIALRSAPSAKSEQLINEKATQILKASQFLKIDNTVTVVEECTQAEWSRVRVKEPNWLKNSHVGWVQSSALREQKKTRGGTVEFTEADFVWDMKILPHKKVIVAGVNKVHRENSRCKIIDPETAYISPSKGSHSDPVFFVTCGTGTDSFNAYFSKSEVENGTALSAAKHIDRTRAINLCESFAKSKTNYPSTFTFSRVTNLTVNEHANGRTTVTSSFTAKNRLNLELMHSVRCLLDASGLIEANVTDGKPA